MATTFSNKCEILSDIWIDHADDEVLKDFIKYNDLGLPLAYAVREGLATMTDSGNKWINETWDSFLTLLNLEDKQFTNVEEIFALA